VTHPTRTVFEGRIVRLTLEQVRLPNGAQAEFEIVHHPGGAGVVAIDSDNRVCLLRQYRPALREWLWEIPAGKLDPGETPLTTATRELEEEAGVRAKQWQSLGKVISSPGVFTEAVHLFLARDLTHVAANAEAHEAFEVHWLPFAEALQSARDGDYTDGKTIIALLRAASVVTLR
jgi:ADP-ribose pyrophosphatase